MLRGGSEEEERLIVVDNLEDPCSGGVFVFVTIDLVPLSAHTLDVRIVLSPLS